MPESPALSASLLELLGGDVCALPHLEEALTHPSYANERRGSGRGDSGRRDYQRLEFLGDSVLGLVASEELMRRFPEAREGELSLMRARVVSTEALAVVATSLELGPALRLGRGADLAGERAQASVLADAMEALVGALYLDRGFGAAAVLARAIVERGLERGGPRPSRDPKSELQERVQALGSPAPVYAIVHSEGPDHARAFRVEVTVAGRSLATGSGRSKKRAEQEAARAALEALDRAALETVARAEHEATRAPEPEPDADPS